MSLSAFSTDANSTDSSIIPTPNQGWSSPATGPAAASSSASASASASASVHTNDSYLIAAAIIPAPAPAPAESPTVVLSSTSARPLVSVFHVMGTGGSNDVEVHTSQDCAK